MDPEFLTWSCMQWVYLDFRYLALNRLLRIWRELWDSVSEGTRKEQAQYLRIWVFQTLTWNSTCKLSWGYRAMVSTPSHLQPSPWRVHQVHLCRRCHCPSFQPRSIKSDLLHQVCGKENGVEEETCEILVWNFLINLTQGHTILFSSTVREAATISPCHWEGVLCHEGCPWTRCSRAKGLCPLWGSQVWKKLGSKFCTLRCCHGNIKWFSYHCIWFSSILGTPFYLMEYVEGRIFKNIRLPGLTPAQRRDIYLAMCQVLSQIHQVNLKKAGLEDFSRPGEL